MMARAPLLDARALSAEYGWQERRPRAKRADWASASKYGAAFALFLVLNAVLVLRPAELVPSLEGWPIYQFVILGCIVAAASPMLKVLRWGSLRKEASVVCVLCLLPAVIFSHLSHGNTWDARYDAIDFGKVLIYYVLLIALVTSPSRLRTFLLFVVASVTGVAGLSILGYYGILDIEALSPVAQAMGADDAGDMTFVPRLQGPGILHDPNDFSLVIVLAIMVLLTVFISSRRATHRLMCLASGSVLVYAFALTRSRGGFLALMGAVLVQLFSRLSWRKATLVTLLVVPPLLAVAGARQTNIDIDDPNDTAQGRIHLWRDSMVVFHHVPIFGIGKDKLADEIGMVAHNSYVQAYAELGVFGGSLFCAGIFFLFASLIRAGRAEHLPAQDPALLHWRVCVLSILTGFAIGMYSLTRVFTVTTYLALGVAAAYCCMAGRTVPAIQVPVGRRWFARVAAVGIACLFILEIFVRVMVR